MTAASLKRVLGFRSTRSADGRQPAPKNVGSPPASDRSRPEDRAARSLALAQGHCKNPCRASASCGTRIAKALAAQVRRINCSGALRWPWPGTGLQCRACTSSCRLLRSARSSRRPTGGRAWVGAGASVDAQGPNRCCSALTGSNKSWPAASRWASPTPCPAASKTGPPRGPGGAAMPSGLGAGPWPAKKPCRSIRPGGQGGAVAVVLDQVDRAAGKGFARRRQQAGRQQGRGQVQQHEPQRVITATGRRRHGLAQAIAQPDPHPGAAGTVQQAGGWQGTVGVQQQRGAQHLGVVGLGRTPGQGGQAQRCLAQPRDGARPAAVQCLAGRPARPSRRVPGPAPRPASAGPQPPGRRPATTRRRGRCRPASRGDARLRHGRQKPARAGSRRPACARAPGRLRCRVHAACRRRARSWLGITRLSTGPVMAGGTSVTSVGVKLRARMRLPQLPRVFQLSRRPLEICMMRLAVWPMQPLNCCASTVLICWAPPARSPWCATPGRRTCTCTSTSTP